MHRIVIALVLLFVIVLASFSGVAMACACDGVKDIALWGNAPFLNVFNGVGILLLSGLAVGVISAARKDRSNDVGRNDV